MSDPALTGHLKGQADGLPFSVELRKNEKEFAMHLDLFQKKEEAKFGWAHELMTHFKKKAKHFFTIL